MNELLAIALVASAAIALRAVVHWVMKRASIFPSDETERSQGFQDVIKRLRDRRDRR